MQIPRELAERITDTARSYAEIETRLLREAENAGLRHPDYMWDKRYLTSSQVAMLIQAVAAELATQGAFEDQWWVGTGGSWGDDVRARLDRRAPNREQYVDQARAIIRPLLDEIEVEFRTEARGGLQDALTAWNAK